MIVVPTTNYGVFAVFQALRKVLSMLPLCPYFYLVIFTWFLLEVISFKRYHIHYFIISQSFLGHLLCPTPQHQLIEGKGAGISFLVYVTPGAQQSNACRSAHAYWLTLAFRPNSCKNRNHFSGDLVWGLSLAYYSSDSSSNVAPSAEHPRPPVILSSPSTLDTFVLRKLDHILFPWNEISVTSSLVFQSAGTHISCWPNRLFEARLSCTLVVDHAGLYFCPC